MPISPSYFHERNVFKVSNLMLPWKFLKKILKSCKFFEAFDKAVEKSISG